MPKGRNKGFQYYMCKKFFHPSNPQNLERVFIAKQRLEAKEQVEAERADEYSKEQERWQHRNILSKEETKERLQLSFMYEPPAGVAKGSDEAGGSKEKGEQFKFEWQRSAPRESYAKEDPNITDHPFGINVQFTRCLKCQVWGHSHTDKHCPRYGQARDHEEPVQTLDEKKLIESMKGQGLQFASYGAWDNGKTRKQYDMVFSSNDEDKEDLLNLVTRIKKKKKKPVKRSKKKKKRIDSPSEKSVHHLITENSSSDCSGPESSSESQKRGEAKAYKNNKSKKQLMDKVDQILAPSPKKITPKLMSKIDDILFSDIATSSKDKKKGNFLSEVDRILGNSRVSDANINDSDEVRSEDPADTETESDNDAPDDELTESEMRLLNLITINKIDVKVNFPTAYPDTHCHFCREEESRSDKTYIWGSGQFLYSQGSPCN